MASKIGAIFGKLLGGARRSPRRQTGSSRPSAPPAASPTAPSRSGAPSRNTTLRGARIEYNPDLDGDADPGEVVWTWVPYEEDPSQGKDRPVLIVGHRAGWLIGVMLTSKFHDHDQIEIGNGSWDREGRVSYAKIDRVLEVDAAQVRREGAILGRSHFDDVIAALRGRES